MRNIIILIFIASLLLQSCFRTSYKSLIEGDTQYMYNPSLNILQPDFFVTNTSSGNSRLYTKIYLSNIKFIIKDTTNRRFTGKIKIKYEIYSPENLDLLVDSASNVYNVIKTRERNNIITYININANLLNEYYIKIITTDLYKGTSVKDFVFVSNKNSSKQNFLIKLNNTSLPYFKNYYRKNNNFVIKYKNNVDSIYIKYYKKKISLPHPPNSLLVRDSLSGACDSIWSVAYNNSIRFNENKFGLYLFQTDKTSKNALSLMYRTENYPLVKLPQEMLFPIQYLTKKEEFKKLYKSPNKKLAIDRFWLSCGKNPQRSRELIRFFYNRALYANINFSSFTEGWNTDRGMIYIIFGPPKAVKKTAKKEEWIYSDRLNEKLLIFKFNKVDNIFSDNDYVLKRHSDFGKFWVDAIESWRNGKVYSAFK